jgi:hypothetical protein
MRLDTFFERLGEQQEQQSPDVSDRDLLDDATMIAAGREMSALYELRAERAGVDLDDLQHEIAQLVERAVQITLGRMLVSSDVVAEVRMSLRSAGLQFFLAGALWQQERELPSLDGPS